MKKAPFEGSAVALITPFNESGVDYKKLSIAVIMLQVLILYVFVFYYQAPVFYMTLTLITSTALGMLPHYIGVGKSHLMGILIIPAIVIYMQMFI